MQLMELKTSNFLSIFLSPAYLIYKGTVQQTSCATGCVEVVGCLKSKELVSWDDVPESVTLEGFTNFCWLCENPKIYEAALRGLTAMQGPLPVKFQLPDPNDRFSLRPGRLSFKPFSSDTVVRSERVNTAIAGARAAATQFSRNNQGIASTAYNVSEESPAVGPSRGGSGATTVSEHAETRLSLRNDKSVNTTKPEVSASTECSQVVATRSYRNPTHVMDPTGGVGADGDPKRGSNTPLGGTNKGPLSVKIPLPDPSDRFSLRPGRLSLKLLSSGTVVRSARVNTAIAGARAAATQFSRNNQGIASTAYNVSEDTLAVGPSRGGSGALTVSEHAATQLSLRNNKGVNTTKVEVSASTEGLQAVATRSH